ncbi:tRNA pseudouridine13 synthase [Methylomarinovum tepidoasis]|uniref:tRNA pseudouridine synthase D n=1 Tax=Methylomarinovum tepidoasis TaxID=2840183 RepID=A0AAU9C7L1_9GAMM|nr:tRNA pseudouridine(13) synthase TruD [Methylomarinovum sp. IN45]BCX87797.1 tRNA pseudouridine13 synthase [Methylomarinovum sp. IN45]
MKPPTCPRTFGPPLGRAQVKQAAEDFQVEEILGFTPSGEGEHVFLWVEKRGRNTEDVAMELARFAGVPRRQVSYAGLKDRHALTWQWFCVHLPGRRELPWDGCRGDGFAVLRWTRNRRRLRKGALQGNRFRLRLQGFDGDRAAFEARLQQIARRGMPNYFGPQRFGHGGGNLARAVAMLQGEKVRSRHHRGLYLSAARAVIFNQVLALRVEAGCWDRALPGDLLMFDGGGAFFRAEGIDAEIEARMARLALHPTGPLWGEGEGAVGEAGAWEHRAVSLWPDLAAALVREAKMQRRPLRVRVRDLRWEWEEPAALRLSFTLPAGSYATGLVHELIETGEEIP